MHRSVGVLVCRSQPEALLSRDVTALNTYNLTVSEIESFVSPPLADSGYDACSMYERNYANVTEDDILSFAHGNHSNSDNLTETPCNAWTYDKSDYHSTVITEV